MYKKETDHDQSKEVIFYTVKIQTKPVISQ